MATTRKRRKAVRRTEILAAATEVFREKPFAQASLGEIAARADCVEGTIYAYFRDKRDLFDAVLAAFYDRLIADIEPRFATIDGTGDRLRYLVSRHLQIAVEDPGFALLIPREAKGPRPYYGSPLHDLNRRYSRFMLRTLQDGVGRGDLRADLDVQLARDLVFGGLEHCVINALGRGRRIEPARAARELVRMLLVGWSAADGSRPEAPVPPVRDLERRLTRIEGRLRGQAGKG
jgi:AcrR family transcriptional regulator